MLWETNREAFKQFRRVMVFVIQRSLLGGDA